MFEGVFGSRQPVIDGFRVFLDFGFTERNRALFEIPGEAYVNS